MSTDKGTLNPKFLKDFIENFGARYSEILGIKLEGGVEEEIFKWFLASILFGAPIRESTVIKTYRQFEERGILTPESILGTGWHGLVLILDDGGYARYDFKTADKLLEVMKNLIERYDGKLTQVHFSASDPQNLEDKLKNLGKGIGAVTVNIFLRELRGIWGKAKPNPAGHVTLAAGNLGIIVEDSSKGVLQQLEEFWLSNAIPGKSFVNFESALLRLGRDFCRKRKCLKCPAIGNCIQFRMV
ncbi:MAG: hypothetical protein RMK50_06915 [Nitrososphaerota archaeon]|nr:hypothetical protein [Candidatus Bathyarchaeota archaeon]MDW8194529.1 hypothetical protein [Nitrososphaerota archaeon]